ncbi:MAG: alpha/beta hydrolase [Polyangiaceae bacterium]
MAAGAHGFEPVYFGRGIDDGRALFGWYHPPRLDAPHGEAVLICPPLGYEGICAHPSLRRLAERLADVGHPVLRFDYEGTGDAGGHDADPDRLTAWIASIEDAATELAALSDRDAICLFGLRIGATLAATAAAQLSQVQRLALWASCTRGRTYLREMKAFRALAEQTGEMTFKPHDDGSVESGGFLISAETIRALSTLDLGKLDGRIADAVLVLHRDDAREDTTLVDALRATGSEVTVATPEGYAAMMTSPEASILPEALVNALLDWLGEHPPRSKGGDQPQRALRAHGLVAPKVREQALRFGDHDELVGILTRPVATYDDARPLLIFTNTAGNYRIGPSRLYVDLARRWAEQGWSSLRIDVSGVGDSIIHDQEADNHPYADRLFADAQAAMRTLERNDVADRFILAGLCSGAFVAYHTARRDPAVAGIILINPQTFAWHDGMSLHVNPLKAREKAKYYQSRILDPAVWKKALRGGIDLGHVATFAKARAADGLRSALAKAKAKLPARLSTPSDVDRTFTELTDRGTDVLIVFSSNDPGIDNLNATVGAGLDRLSRRPNFSIAVIDGPDHSFTPLWAQHELAAVLTDHLTRLQRSLS